MKSVIISYGRKEQRAAQKIIVGLSEALAHSRCEIAAREHLVATAHRPGAPIVNLKDD